MLGTIECFKETIVKHLNKLDNLLSARESKFGKQLKINYDLIEVLDGWCFSISRREFTIIWRSSQWKCFNLSSWKERSLKKFRLERESNPWPLRYRCSARKPSELSSQLGAGQLRVRIYPVDGEMNMNIRNNHIFELRIKMELYEDHRSEGVLT